MEPYEQRLCEIILNFGRAAQKEMLFEDFSTLRFGDHFHQQSRLIWSILVKFLMRKICVKLF